jgi:chromosome segregation ATPase
MESNDVESMSVRQLNTAIKERDAAKKAEQTAREQAAAAEKERMEARQELYTHRANEAELKKEVAKLTADLNKASAAKDKADKEIARLKATPNIPEDVKKQLIEQAEKDAAAAAENTIRERLSVMEAQLQEAVAAREAAEASAADSQRMNRDAKFADPDAAAVRILFESLQETYNKISGHLLKISGRDPETAKKMKKIITDWAKGVGGKTA